MGVVALIAWFAIGFGEASLGYLAIEPVDFLHSYAFGGIQSAVAGFIVYFGLRDDSFIDLRRWVALTLILGVVPAAIIMSLESKTDGLVMVSASKISFYVMLATCFASFVLRYLIIYLGWMRKPGMLRAETK